MPKTLLRKGGGMLQNAAAVLEANAIQMSEASKTLGKTGGRRSLRRRRIGGGTSAGTTNVPAPEHPEMVTAGGVDPNKTGDDLTRIALQAGADGKLDGGRRRLSRKTSSRKHHNELRRTTTLRKSRSRRSRARSLRRSWFL